MTHDEKEGIEARAEKESPRILAVMLCQLIDLMPCWQLDELLVDRPDTKAIAEMLNKLRGRS